jgi:3-oxoacyl-[acyl-carrier protein] reductase
MARKMKTHLITGAGHFPGIGSQTALDLLESGDAVSICSRSFDSTWSELEKIHTGRINLYPGDIRSVSVQQSWIQDTLDHWGSIDSLINNASPTDIPCYDDSKILDRKSWQANLDLNVIVAYELSMRCKDILTQSQGSIINIGSRAGIQCGIGNNIAYSISKAAMHHLTKELALELAPIRVNAVSSGFVMSQRMESIYQENIKPRRDQNIRNSLLKSEITPSSISSAIIYLINAEHTTGQILSICSGATIQPPYINISPLVD